MIRLATRAYAVEGVAQDGEPVEEYGAGGRGQGGKGRGGKGREAKTHYETEQDEGRRNDEAGAGGGAGGEGQGARSFVACLSHMTIDDAPLSRRSTEDSCRR